MQTEADLQVQLDQAIAQRAKIFAGAAADFKTGDASVNRSAMLRELNDTIARIEAQMNSLPGICVRHEDLQICRNGQIKGSFRGDPE